LLAALESSKEPPSRRIAKLNRLMELLDSQENWLMRIIGPPLLYGTQLAFMIEAWRAESGPHVRQWMEAIGEFEALSALAGSACSRWAPPSGPAIRCRTAPRASMRRSHGCAGWSIWRRARVRCCS